MKLSQLKISMLGSLLLFCSTVLLAQTEKSPDIKMSAKYSSKDADLRDLLTFEKIDYFKIYFTGQELIGKDYQLIAKEIWDGKVKNVDTLVNTATSPMLEKLSKDTLSFKVVAKKTLEDKLKMLFIFQKFRFTQEYDATDSKDYSLRLLGHKFEIKSQEKFYAMAYILPYEKDGWKYWCKVDSSGKDVESWGAKFGIKHYVVFEMKFE